MVLVGTSTSTEAEPRHAPSGTSIAVDIVRAYGQAHVPERIPALAGPLDRLSDERSRQDHGTDGFGTFGRANIGRGEAIAVGRDEPQGPNLGYMVQVNALEVVPSFLAAHGMTDSAQGLVQTSCGQFNFDFGIHFGGSVQHVIFLSCY